MKTIRIVLTKYSDLLSNFIYVCSGGGYTHASLVLDTQSDIMYSFNYKGFCIETLEKHRRRGVKKSLCYDLLISDAAYGLLQRRIHHFEAQRAQYSYTRFGAIMCFLRIPFQWKNHYFCSQFIAETLIDADAVRLRMQPSLYLPNHLWHELAHCLQLKRIQYNPV